MSEAKHTATPWVVRGKGYIETEDGVMVADVMQMHFDGPDNAAFIVRACNCHDELLAACQAFLARFQNHMVNADALFGDVAEQARAAIARATQQESEGE